LENLHSGIATSVCFRSGLTFLRMRIENGISAVSSMNKKMYHYSPLSNYSKFAKDVQDNLTFIFIYRIS